MRLCACNFRRSVDMPFVVIVRRRRVGCVRDVKRRSKALKRRQWGVCMCVHMEVAGK